MIELLCSVALVLPAIYRRYPFMAPIAAIIIAGEMLLYCVVLLLSGDSNYGPMIYWLVVAAICAVIAYGRVKARPLT